MTKAVLFDYFRSSASYRVRIALNLKGIEWESVPIDLRTGAQSAPPYRARNPQGLVPLLEIDALTIGQSLAIIDYLEATRPSPALLPTAPADRAHVLGLALVVACDMHPLNNLRVLKYLARPLGVSETERNAWYHHWLREGFTALEAMAAPRAGRFLFGDSPSLADVFLVPQMANARRLEFPLGDYPVLVAADAEAGKLDAFSAAHPDHFENTG
ncbi:MAG: maiA [Alphaproteobacteria bacterium]|nr:maiA [Alphaproteobacteria bacterium]